MVIDRSDLQVFGRLPSLRVLGWWGRKMPMLSPALLICTRCKWWWPVYYHGISCGNTPTLLFDQFPSQEIPGKAKISQIWRVKYDQIPQGPYPINFCDANSVENNRKPFLGGFSILRLPPQWPFLALGANNLPCRHSSSLDVDKKNLVKRMMWIWPVFDVDHHCLL